MEKHWNRIEWECVGGARYWAAVEPPSEEMERQRKAMYRTGRAPTRVGGGKEWYWQAMAQAPAGQQSRRGYFRRGQVNPDFMQDESHRKRDIQDAQKAAEKLVQAIYNDPGYAAAFATEMARLAFTNNTKKHMRSLLGIAAGIMDANVMFGPFKE